jgi:hypothetical protein
MTANLKSICNRGAGSLGRLIILLQVPQQYKQYRLPTCLIKDFSIKNRPNNDNRLYIAASGGTPKLIRIDNANAASPAFTDIAITGIAANTNVSSIDVETGNQNHLLVTVSNYGVTSVFESTNGGGSWTNVEGNLPDMQYVGEFL